MITSFVTAIKRVSIAVCLCCRAGWQIRTGGVPCVLITQSGVFHHIRTVTRRMTLCVCVFVSVLVCDLRRQLTLMEL